MQEEAEVKITIITQSSNLPNDMTERNFFHSVELFRMVEQTRGQTPYMVVAWQNGHATAHMLAILRRRGSLIPPYLFTQGRIYGEGDYDEGTNREHLFSLMLEAITRHLRRRLCLYIEFSNLSTKMFAYRHFRHNGYFPVKWMTIHNSLHSLPPAERLTPRAKAHIEHGTNSGVKTQTVKDYDDFRDFYRMLRRFFSLKLRRFLPSERLFYELGHSSSCDLFITKYNEKVIGGCAVVYSDNDAYLWYMGSRRKRYAHLHPGTMTVWHALEEAHRKHCHHFHFMDVGLPFRKDMRREFILRFGGKPVGSYRWFYCTIGWLNKTIGWLFRE